MRTLISTGTALVGQGFSAGGTVFLGRYSLINGQQRNFTVSD